MFPTPRRAQLGLLAAVAVFCSAMSILGTRSFATPARLTPKPLTTTHLSPPTPAPVADANSALAMKRPTPAHRTAFHTQTP